jgi:hypothetical protein
VIALAALAGCLTAPETMPDTGGGIPHSGTQPPQGPRPCQWRVVWTENPATEATICWTTAERAEESWVEFGPRQRSAGYEMRLPSEDGRYTGRTELFYHWVRLAALEPDTVYYFTATSDGESMDSIVSRERNQDLMRKTVELEVMRSTS